MKAAPAGALDDDARLPPSKHHNDATRSSIHGEQRQRKMGNGYARVLITFPLIPFQLPTNHHHPAAGSDDEEMKEDTADRPPVAATAAGVAPPIHNHRKRTLSGSMHDIPLQEFMYHPPPPVSASAIVAQHASPPPPIAYRGKTIATWPGMQSRAGVEERLARSLAGGEEGQRGTRSTSTTRWSRTGPSMTGRARASTSI